ncbi:hypothetical protein [Rhodococcus erythropolis]|uniref:hypothetical protein n=1 Tax=Rhodococcus erythropolis TaxID=1833 RepID=UPI001BECFE5B|nr:hypothetical protein [Rhodococcus erythropolis]MBT2269639.1 hypothetical protein [Rhodococcus erythropolis]
MSPTPTNKKAVDTARKSAEALAHKALQARVSLVGAIGEAQASAQEILDQREVLLAKHAQELEALDVEHAHAEDKIKTAYDTAISGGWTARELTDMGYSAPKKKKARRQKPAAAETTSPTAPPASLSHTGEQPSNTDHND